MTRTNLISLSLAILLVCVAGQSAAAPSVETVCESSTWMNCGLAVKKALEANPKDPKVILSIAGAWGRAYDRRFDELRKTGHLEKSTPDSEKIYDAVKSELDPVEIGVNKAVDALLKKYLPRVAAILEATATPIAALTTFFDSSEIATDRQELDLMNEDLQQRIATALEPWLVADWKAKLTKAATDAGPQLKAP